MREQSQRLMSLLAGNKVTKPPYWEPWFAMRQVLARRYGGSYLSMALDLGHAAVPLGGVDLKIAFRAPIEPDDAIRQSGVSYGGGALRDREQLRQRPEPDWQEALERIQPLRRACAQAGIACWMVLPWCFHALATSMGLEHFALACYDRPGFVHEAACWVEARNRAAIERVVRQVRPDFLLFDGDCAYKTGAMIAPAMMRDFCVAPWAANVRLVQDMGIPVVFHSDGKLDDVIPFLIDLGVAAVHGCESQANKLAHLVDRFGAQIVLCGNMDVVFLKEATPAQVRAATLEMLRTGAARRRFVAGCNTSPQDYIPEENYAALLRAVAEYEPRQESKDVESRSGPGPCVDAGATGAVGAGGLPGPARRGAAGAD